MRRSLTGSGLASQKDDSLLMYGRRRKKGKGPWILGQKQSNKAYCSDATAQQASLLQNKTKQLALVTTNFFVEDLSMFILRINSCTYKLRQERSRRSKVTVHHQAVEFITGRGVGGLATFTAIKTWCKDTLLMKDRGKRKMVKLARDDFSLERTCPCQ